MDYEFEVGIRYHPIGHSEGNLNGKWSTVEQKQARYFPFTKYHHLKATLYTHPLCVKVTSLLGNKFAQVYNSGDFIFVAPMNSKSDVGIGLMDICDENIIPEGLRYNNGK